ncbi:histidine kinase [Spirulina major CS-329]|uniref:histidine kinase n=1 Tax=Spirulina TaxID=1154 RepID=UPI00232B6744|nr:MULTISPECIES: histidine kinase [Spirulina]MDB9495775.1 histidine kinase [Spirulina subsalsa CS-330]MDB9503223.1 histidine kinase [Spirulina major CS-329]
MRSSNFEPTHHSAVSTGATKQLQLLLFVDERISTQNHAQQIQSYLEELKQRDAFDLEILEISENPDLAEHFRLVATPSLVKIYPSPRQVLAGGDVVAQLQHRWHQWQQDLEEQNNAEGLADRKSEDDRYSVAQIRAAEELFRLKRENNELREQLQFKDQVLGMLAHDLRSPLTAALIAVETLEITHNQESTEQVTKLQKQLYQHARTQFRVMNRMINDILQAAQGKNSGLQIQLHNLPLQPLCEEVLDEMQGSLEEKSLTLVRDIPKDVPPVYADGELIRQVLMNLLDNAIKYTPPQGTITVSILHRTAQKVQVSVADTGLGIPVEKRDRIFDGHFRLKRDEAQEGFGIGLSLCRKVIQAHYGQIWVDSVPPEGSCFQFTLPVYR